MSQLKDKLAIIERDSGLAGLIVRPLCAQHMPETFPEREGVIDRSRLLAINGRRRREQMDLAEKLAVGDYPCPAGGCLLTDKPFAARVRDALAHGGLELEDIAMLKVGRHFRLPGGGKLVVGRNQEENERIDSLVREGDVRISPEKVVGPLAVMRPDNGKAADIDLAARITASFCDGEGCVMVSCRMNGTVSVLNCERKERSAYDGLRV